jgi:ribosomal-protein-alanine N-acetyltransferase
MPGLTVIQTSRLMLRSADEARLEALIAAPGSFTFLTSLRVAEGYCPFPGALEFSLWRLRGASPDARPWWAPFLVVLRETRTLIGLCGYKGPPSRGAVEIGYSIAPAHQGLGLATEAVEALCAHALRFYGIGRVLAHTLPHTSASTRVLEKNGFRRRGEITDPKDGLLWRWAKSRAGKLSQGKPSH